MSTRWWLAAGGAAVILGVAGCAPVSATAPGPVPTAEPTSLPTPSYSGEPSGDLIPVSPYLVFAGPDPDGTTVSASGAVSDLLESDGECVFTFSPKTGDPIVLESRGVTDATYTSCGMVSASTSRFPSGTWTVVLSYLSANASGHSDATMMEIP